MGQLLVFVHPKCPCTRATIDALAELVASHDTSRVTIDVFFYRPLDASDDFLATNTFRRTARIPGIRMHTDVNGAMAARADARTSGAVRFYDSSARLRFQGGLTPSRGHAGDSAALVNLRALVRGEGAATLTSPVFGCAILPES